MNTRTNPTATATPAAATTRRLRYARSSTTSVTQLLTESCTSLLQRLTTRVRGPSAIAESSRAALTLGITRSRLEDKYSAVLDRYRPNDPSREATPEPMSPPPSTFKPSAVPISKSATSASILLAEKAYPYVAAITSPPPRDKTPYKHGGERRLSHRDHHHHHHHHRHQIPPQQSQMSIDPIQQKSQQPYRSRHKSGQAELRLKKPSAPVRPIRVGKSEQNNPSGGVLSLCTDEAPNEPADPGQTDRETKRKEIQSLIIKYSALDELYNKSTLEADRVEQPLITSSSLMTNKYQHKLAPVLPSTVSRQRSSQTSISMLYKYLILLHLKFS